MPKQPENEKAGKDKKNKNQGESKPNSQASDSKNVSNSVSKKKSQNSVSPKDKKKNWTRCWLCMCGLRIISIYPITYVDVFWNQFSVWYVGLPWIYDFDVYSECE